MAQVEKNVSSILSSCNNPFSHDLANSWGFIAGSGGKCHSAAKSLSYGTSWGFNDRVAIVMDFDKGTIEFFVNDASQGIAFANLKGPVRIAASLTGTASSLTFMNALVAFQLSNLM